MDNRAFTARPASFARRLTRCYVARPGFRRGNPPPGLPADFLFALAREIGYGQVHGGEGSTRGVEHDRACRAGPRLPTHYGIETARKLAYQLAYVGVTVVSGGARDIDTAAHQVALNAKGRTVVVLGNGIKHSVPIPPPTRKMDISPQDPAPNCV